MGYGRVNVIPFPSPDDAGAADETVPVGAENKGPALTIVEGGKSGRIVELWRDELLICALTQDETGIWAVTPQDGSVRISARDSQGPSKHLMR